MEADASALRRLSIWWLLTLAAVTVIVLQLLLFPALSEPGQRLLWFVSLLGLALMALLPIWRARMSIRPSAAEDIPGGLSGPSLDFADDLLRRQSLAKALEHVAGVGSWEMSSAKASIRWSSGAISLLAPLAATQDLLPWLDAVGAEELTKNLQRGWAHGVAFTSDCRFQPPGRPARWLQLIGQPQKNAEGRVIGMAGALVDITRLHASEQRYQCFTQRLADISQRVSAVALSDAERLELIGRQLLQAVGASALVLSDAESLPEDLQQQWMPEQALAPWGGLEGLDQYLVARNEGREAIRRFDMVEEGGQRLLRCRLPRSGEAHGWLLLLDPALPPLNEGDDCLLSLLLGSFASALIRRRDVESMAALRQQLEDQLRQKFELMGGLNHEIGGPLSGITNVLQALEEGQFGVLDDRHRRLLASSARTGQHINELISNLLDAAQLESGQLPLRRRLCDLGGLAADAIKRCKPLATEKRQRLELREPHPCFAYLDPQRGLQMLVQLIGNAIKYTPSGGTIWVSVRRRHDGRPSLSVCDTGIGIRRRARADIARPFVREESSYAQPGWGLALAMADMVATLHEGRMRIHSRGHRGSRLSIDFPRARRRQLVESP